MIRRRFVVELMVLLSLFAAGTMPAQTGDDVAGKAIRFHVNFPKDTPLQVKSLTIHGKPAPLDMPVPLMAGWLDDVALTVTNTSPKTLTYVSGTLIFRSLTLVQAMHGVKYAVKEGGGGELGFSMDAGVRSEFLLHRKDGTRAPTPRVPSVAIAPGETVTMRMTNVGPDDSAQVNALLPASSEAEFMLSMTWYADDTCFFNGKYQRVADFNQRKLEPISAEEFRR